MAYSGPGATGQAAGRALTGPIMAWQGAVQAKKPQYFTESWKSALRGWTESIKTHHTFDAPPPFGGSTASDTHP